MNKKKTLVGFIITGLVAVGVYLAGRKAEAAPPTPVIDAEITSITLAYG